MALTYWEKRALQRMLDAQARADTAMRQIDRAVKKALRELLESIEHIASRYATSYGLTEQEARAWLKAPADRAEYERVMAEIAALPDGADKQRLQARAASGAYAYRISRQEAMMAHVRAQAAAYGVKVEQEAKAALQEAGEASTRSTHEDVTRAGIGVAFDGDVRDAVDEILRTPWNGGNYSKRVWHNTDALEKLLEDTILSGFLAGRSPKKIAADVAERMDVAYYQAERLVRTEVSRLQNATALQAMQRAGVEEYQWLGTLDKRTCPVCGALDGRRFTVKYATVGVTLPPAHPFCRCTIVPYLGDDAADATRFARDAQGAGIKVPAGTSYEQWREQQEKQLGAERFAMEQKRAQNTAADQRQWEAYRNMIGKTPHTSDVNAFVSAKYGDPETYALLKLDYRRRSALASDATLALPNADAASAADAKFTGYLFNPDNADGWAKGVAIDSRLGYNGDNWKEMRREILRGALQYPSTHKGDTQHGARYEQRMVLYGTKRAPANVLVGWLVNGNTTHMTSAYIKEVSNDEKTD